MADLEFSLKELRQECRDAWWTEPGPVVELFNGPLRGEKIPQPNERVWQGAWFDDAGQQILVNYELNDRGLYEYAGSKTMADMATDAANEFFGEVREEESQVDLETMPADEALAFLEADNDRRVVEIRENTGGQVDLENAFDILEILTLVRYLARAQGEKFWRDASLDFENKRSLKLDEIEDQYTKMVEAREVAMRQAALQGNPPPMGPMHQGRVTMPPRRIRRGG